MKKVKGLLCLFIIATLFFVASTVWATGDNGEKKEAVDPVETLTQMVRKAKMDAVHTKITTSSGMEFDDRYAIELGKIDYFDKTTNRIKINDQLYQVKVRYKTETGEYKESGNLALKEAEDGSVVAVFRNGESVPEGTQYEIGFVLMKGDSSLVTQEGSDVWVNAGTFTSEEITEATPGRTTLWQVLKDVVTLNFSGALEKLRRIVVESICRILVPMGDAFLDMISCAVGEVATIDRVVYGDMKKTDINFFESSSSSESSLSTPLKETMGEVITPLYRLLRGIAIMVYMVILVYIGLRILLGSTATKRADYKSFFSAWMVGLAMLFLFPYAMKYTIKLNEALCKSIERGEEVSTEVEITSLAPRTYGKDEFVARMLTKANIKDDMMLYVRTAGASYYNIPLIIIYFIMIGELFALLIMYYKRVFMLAFLISIFPLVIIFYPLTKVGAARVNPFGVWMKEYCVNVFVQSFHAATYATVVTIGIKAYMNSQNWLFMLMAVLFLFEGEKVIRAIFGAESKANTIGTIAMSGALAWKFVKGTTSLVPDLSKKSGGAKDDKDKINDKAKKDMIKPTTTPGASKNLANANGSGGGSSSGVANITAGQTNMSAQATVDQQLKKQKDSTRRKITEGIANAAGTIVQVGAQGAGAMLGGAYGMAQSDESAIVTGMTSGIATGSIIGGTFKNGMISAVSKVNDIRDARILAGEYLAGEHDGEIGIAEADAQLDREKTEAMRNVYAKLAQRTGGFSSKERAEIKFLKERLQVQKEYKN